MNAQRSGGLVVGLLLAAAVTLLAAVGMGVDASTAELRRSNLDRRGTPVAAASPTPMPTQVPAADIEALPGALDAATSEPSPAAKTPQPTIATAAEPLPSPSPSASPSEVASPRIDAEGGQTIGYSVEGRPIVAHRIGQGPIKAVLVGDIHGEFEANTHELAQQLLAYYVNHPEEVPSSASLWIIPTMNPDGLATGHRWNAHDVDLNRNADTDLDGCAGNDWSPDTVGWEGDHLGAGGEFPFSEPETLAVRDFLADAWLVVFYHSAAEAIFVDTCQRHTPTAELARVLSLSTGYVVPEEGWAGYPITGDLGDYLAGEGVASVTVELADHEDPEFERNLQGVQSLLPALEGIVAAEASRVGAEFSWLDASSVGIWRYAEDSFLHPLSIEVVGDTAYLLDTGRVLALDLQQPNAPNQVLAPGDEVEGVRVLEPLDLAADEETLLVLDRAGDVYAFATSTNAWTVAHYGRASAETYDHYSVALAAGGGERYLLDTTHERIWRFAGDQPGSVWAELPQSRDIDLSVSRNRAYVLTRALNGPLASVRALLESRGDSGFRPNVDLMHPRQLYATESVLYVLDRSGRRLVALDAATGALRVLYQFPDRRAVSAVWADRSGQRIILAGRDALYFPGEPSRAAVVESSLTLSVFQPNNLALLDGLRGLQMPIEGASITSRDFQMPGAPRHYRLGVHEGIDFYGHTVGVTVNRKTEVRAVASGIVIRATVDYEPPTEAQAAAWAERWQELGYTPAEVLDGYRGMQVWIEHEGGLVSRYAHLGSIAPGIVKGVQVERGQVIATVGNSGTPASLRSRKADVHLHLELWLGDHYVGQFLRPIEARELVERILR